MSFKIVLGLGFGDEGKGLTTSYLCSKSDNPLVVRFNGGHQAGHTVIDNGVRHVFSTYSAGTLQGVSTYWSKYCTLYPIALVNENLALQKIWKRKEAIPTVYVHPLSPVTTPFDVTVNREKETENKHGSVGVGFGQTLKRHEDFYKIYAQDLFYPTVLRAKLYNIGKNYYDFSNHEILYQIDTFMEYIEECKKLIKIENESFLFSDYDLIFEGAQGILLDQDFGFFPNVTRSNTTSKNAIEILLSDLDLNEEIEIYYVTRSYQTRHGNGFMTNENDPLVVLKNNENETNKLHEFQGEFRIGKLDTELLNYALESDSNVNNHLLHITRNLVVTCLDQHHIDVNELRKELSKKVYFEKTFISNSPDSNLIEI